MYRIEVALPVPLAKNFTYLCESLAPKGTRVRVPFGKRKLIGLVLGESLNADLSGVELKTVEEILDSQPILSPQLLKLASWMSRYYLHPLGEVFKAMLPTAETKKVKETYTLQFIPAEQAALFKQLFAKKKAVGVKTLHKRLKEWNEKNPDAPRLLKNLLKEGCIERHKETAIGIKASPLTEGLARESSAIEFSLPPLNAEQTAVLQKILSQSQDRERTAKTFLLHGVTGSGKTRVYIALIHHIFQEAANTQAQALVLVPEIALTPQMTRVFEEEFPGMVAVVHSALSPNQRWSELSRAREGQARILIGPRSAVFASFQNLKLILVDEEHDQSYKQSSGLSYNGRDVAVVRAHMEGIACLLGSATPALESIWNVMQGKYEHLELKKRAIDIPLPQITIAPVPQKKQIEGLDENVDDTEISFLSPLAITALEDTCRAGHQAIVLVNRRGYAYYLLNKDTQSPIECPECSISLTVHKNRTKLLCHYCGFQSSLAAMLNQHPHASFTTVGVGSQKAEALLKRLLPAAKIARLDSDVLSSREKLFPLLADFRRGAIQILVGTQIIAKGHDFPNVALTVICEIDQMLDLPDFRTGERAFQLIVQAAGRAGRSHTGGKVLIQTQRADHPVVKSALTHDYANFVKHELETRKLYAYPPFTHLIRIELSSSYPERLTELCTEIGKWQLQYFAARKELLKELKVIGPVAPPVERIRSRYRRILLLSSLKLQMIHSLAYDFLASFQERRGDLRIQVDVDPQSLM